MLTIIRKNQQFLMTVIVILTIISFIWLYNRTNLTQVGSNDVLSIYGRVVQRAELEADGRGYQVALALGLTDFVRDLGGLGDDENTSRNQFVINLLVVQHQADELGIRPSDDEVLASIKSLPLFQTDGVFDPGKYATFVQDNLPNRGLTERQMEDVIRDSIRALRLQHIITSPVAVGEDEVRIAARIYQAVNAQVIHFDRDAFLSNAVVSPEDVAVFYDKNKEGLKAAETRDISYVVFDLSEDQQNLTGKDLANALQKLADQADTVGKAIRAGIAQGGDFAKLAEAQSLKPQKIDSLSRDGSQKGKDSGLPEAAVTGAFRLQKSGEISELIQDGNSFYLISVDGITPAHQLELSDVSDKISKLLKSEKASKVAEEAANKTLATIRANMKAGKSFVDAAKAARVTVEPLMGISPADPKNSDEQEGLAHSTLPLKEGELGPLEAAPWGACAIYLEKRTPLTDDEWKKHQDEISKKLLTNDQDLLFQEWLRQSLGTSQFKPLGAAAKSGA